MKSRSINSIMAIFMFVLVLNPKAHSESSDIELNCYIKQNESKFKTLSKTIEKNFYQIFSGATLIPLRSAGGTGLISASLNITMSGDYSYNFIASSKSENYDFLELMSDKKAGRLYTTVAKAVSGEVILSKMVIEDITYRLACDVKVPSPDKKKKSNIVYPGRYGEFLSPSK